MSIVSTDNRMGRAMDWPNLASDSIALVTDVSAPGSSYQNNSYGMSGLGAVVDDITSGNFAALPTDIVNGLNPSTFDIGAYAIVGLVAYLILPKLFKGGKGASRAASRKARLTGQIAQDQALLKNPRRKRRKNPYIITSNVDGYPVYYGKSGRMTADKRDAQIYKDYPHQEDISHAKKIYKGITVKYQA